MEPGQRLVYTVGPSEEGMKLKSVLKYRMGLSRRMLIRLKTVENGITLNGTVPFLNVKVKAGDRVEVRLPLEQPNDIEPEPLPLKILYEDVHLLVVDKPAGMVVHPTRSYRSGTVANAAMYHWMKRGEVCRFHPVHRLDRDTTGVLVVAKHAYIHQQIAEQFISQKVVKEYAALVHGVPPSSEGIIHAPIGRDIVRPYLRTVVPQGGDDAETHYQLVRTWGEASLLRVRPKTGRTHQIRVHLKHIGCPIIGDPLYGPDDDAMTFPRDSRIQRHALHAQKIALIHPATGAKVEFTAEIPDDIRSLMDHLSSRSSRGPSP